MNHELHSTDLQSSASHRGSDHFATESPSLKKSQQRYQQHDGGTCQQNQNSANRDKHAAQPGLAWLGFGICPDVRHLSLAVMNAGRNSLSPAGLNQWITDEDTEQHRGRFPDQADSG